jgi:energy-converting hydrogenase Eha subunit C
MLSLLQNGMFSVDGLWTYEDLAYVGHVLFVPVTSYILVCPFTSPAVVPVEECLVIHLFEK